MNSLKKTTKTTLLIIALMVGTSAGAFINLQNAQAQTEWKPCGYCDFHEGEQLTFCNWTIPALVNGCTENTGYECQQTECSVLDD